MERRGTELSTYLHVQGSENYISYHRGRVYGRVRLQRVKINPQLFPVYTKCKKFNGNLRNTTRPMILSWRSPWLSVYQCT